MKILITGGAGFIGSKVAATLNSHHQIDVVDFPDNANKLSTLDVQYYGADLSNLGDVQELPTHYDAIIHCAAQTGGYYSLKDPQKDCLWNCLGTVNIIELAKRCPKIQKVIYLSSMAVYGEGTEKTENSTLDPISYYGASKLAGEFYTKLCWEHCRIPYSILRLWNTYGSGQDLNNDHQGMLSIYLAQALTSDTINITGSKKRVRDFIHVVDVVKAIELCLEDAETNNQIINVCSAEAFKSEEVIRELARHLNKDLRIKEIDGYAGDQQLSSGCNTKLMKHGWNVSMSLEDGIREFLNNIERMGDLS